MNIKCKTKHNWRKSICGFLVLLIFLAMHPTTPLKAEAPDLELIAGDFNYPVVAFTDVNFPIYNSDFRPHISCCEAFDFIIYDIQDISSDKIAVEIMPDKSGVNVLFLQDWMPSVDGHTATFRYMVKTVTDSDPNITDLSNWATVTLQIETETHEPEPLETTTWMTSLSDNFIPEIRLFENRITVNRTMHVGARIPVHITGSNPASVSTSDMMADGVQSFLKMTSTHPVTGEVELRLQGTTTPVHGYRAWLSDDNRFIEIEADIKTAIGIERASNINNVEVWILPHNAQPFRAITGNNSNTINLTVVERFPGISITAEPLNLFYRKNTSKLTVTITGSDEEVISARLTDIPAGTIAQLVNGDLRLLDNGIVRPRNLTIPVIVEVSGYKTPYRNLPRVTVRIINDVPGLRLSSATLQLQNPGADVAIRLLSVSNRRTLESWGTIDKVTLNGNIVPYEAATGAITISPALTQMGNNNWIKVYFDGGTSPIQLRLNIKPAPNRPTISARTRTLTWNIRQTHETSLIDIITNPINLNPNIAVMQVVDGQVQPLPDYIKANITGNRITLSMTGTPQLRRYTLRIFDKSNPDIKPVDITLNIIDRAVSFTVRLRGRIIITDSKSQVTATVKLNNTTSQIRAVTLYDQKRAGNTLVIPDTVSKDFISEVITGTNTFIISARQSRFGSIVPDVRQNLGVKIELTNGQTITSWTVTNENTGAVRDRPIAITPTVVTVRATQSRRNITLYVEKPLIGENIKLSLLPSHLELGYVNIASATSNQKLGFLNDMGFEIERMGRSDFTIRFKGGIVPKVTGDDPDRLKSNYTVRLELWPEGTYHLNQDGAPVLDNNGSPIPLMDDRGRARTRPVSVNINIFIAQPLYINPLTGQIVDKDISTGRPIAVMYSNARAALPMHGISQADIIFEMPMEGGMTRMLALFQDVSNVGNIGSIRSARPYFCYIMHGYDSIFVHGGGSIHAMPFLGNKDRLDGVYGPTGNAFFRIAGREHVHALFTTGSRINRGINSLNYRTALPDGYKHALRFAGNGTPAGGRAANNVSVRFSGTNTTRFSFNNSNRTYGITLHNTVPYVDGNNNAGVRVANVLILKTSVTPIPNDAEGRLEIQTAGWGDGIFISGGRAIDIRWRRPEVWSEFEFYLPNPLEDPPRGTPVVFTQGRTYICIVPTNAQINLS